MQLITYGHACVRLADGERVLTIDPGIWSAPDALAGTSAVLLTHEHVDHVNAPALRQATNDDPNLRIYAHPEVLATVDGLGAAGVAINAGDRFDAGGFAVHAVGGQHAEIIDGLPGCANLGFIVERAVYHPGDAVFVPDEPVSHLLVPISGPWLKLAEAIEFVRAVGPAHAYPIHDALLSDIGTGLADRWLDRKGGTDYQRLQPGQPTKI